MTYLLPYAEKYDEWSSRTSFSRKQFPNNEVIYYSVWSEYEFPDMWYSSHSAYAFESKEEAMKSLDAVLVKQGYYLIGADEIERFKKLQVLL